MNREREDDAPKTGGIGGKRYRRIVLGTLPSVLVVALIGGWFVDWRNRLAHTEVPEVEIAESTFFEDFLPVVRRLEASVPDSAPERLVLGADLASLLLMADQLGDIQACLDLMRPAMAQIGARADTTTQGVERSAAWAWSLILDSRGRRNFVSPNTAGFGELNDWADARRGLRRGADADLPSQRPPARTPGIPDYSLNASQAVQIAASWEMGLALVLKGSVPEGFERLRLIQGYFSGSVSLSDVSTIRSVPLRAVRFPDLEMPGDLAIGLRRFALDHADSIWRALQPARWDEPETPELESFLRLQLAQAHARARDAAWFRNHRDLLATGPYLNHRWSRQLATEMAAVDLPEPEGWTQAAELGAGDAALLPLLDSIASAAGLDASQSVKRCRLSARTMYRRLENLGTTISTLGAPYGPIAQTLAMAYADSAYGDLLLADWIGMASAEISAAWQRPLALLLPRIQARHALGLLQARKGSPTGLSVNTVRLLSLAADPYPWSATQSGGANGVSLSRYVPGLSTLREVLASVTPEDQPLDAGVSREIIQGNNR